MSIYLSASAVVLISILRGTASCFMFEAVLYLRLCVHRDLLNPGLNQSEGKQTRCFNAVCLANECATLKCNRHAALPLYHGDQRPE